MDQVRKERRMSKRKGRKGKKLERGKKRKKEKEAGVRIAEQARERRTGGKEAER